jgi:hypothetical protein
MTYVRKFPGSPFSILSAECRGVHFEGCPDLRSSRTLDTTFSNVRELRIPQILFFGHRDEIGTRASGLRAIGLVAAEKL